MSDTSLIELDHISYQQQGVEILADCSWRLERGRHWAILGPNGSGKTTLLRIACGYLWPTAGVVRRLGEELIDLRQLRRTIGWVAADLAPQMRPSEHGSDTVVSGKFAQVGLRRLGDQQPTAGDFDAARRLLAQMNCSHLAEKRFGILSQGERQQIFVARARMVDPLLIVLDEPCAGMDPGVRERFLHWLQEQAEASSECAIALVTHHVEEIMPAFESTLIMRGGRVLEVGSTDEVLTPAILESVFGVKMDRLEHCSGRRWPLWHA